METKTKVSANEADTKLRFNRPHGSLCGSEAERTNECSRSSSHGLTDRLKVGFN